MLVQKYHKKCLDISNVTFLLNFCFRSTFLAENPEPCILDLNEEVQREAIAVTEYGYWTTSECKKHPPCPLWFYPFFDCIKLPF